MPYQWLLFDADNTLFDYDKAEAHAIELTFKQLHLPFHPEVTASYRRFNQQVWDDFENNRITLPELRLRRFELLFQAHQINASPEVFSQHYLPNLAAGSDLIKDADLVIKALATRYKIALITNGLKEVQHSRLQNSGLGPCFTAVITSEDAQASKPDLAFFEEVFSRLGSPPREAALVIGDSLTADIKGGSDFGLDTCWYNPAHKPCPPEIRPTWQIDNLSTLLDLL